ncbi:MAG TPA: 2,3-bisphosphoglycerate-independent phosphoglycerate mutase [Flavobacterium sp.]|uniref:2,3-bisphosphoglycerate-independent phosphoglycerate mutase n=1 Tax=Flavobacterium sp. TaxID=239 RepID=UPI002B9A9E79|nr:2,3-bisphosphoglycerate-independent phosphoglycerate mutase [Flavobacterium sp.]HSD15190.1 2,3-bisphosphoglycerate-independent phosphoglycerate mutase [Flavobacterium sp.]
MNKKVILMILDGWGKSPDPKVSAIDNANVPFINSLYAKYPNAQLRTDGLNVGLPDGQMGNSEVGHMNLGAGRIVYQDLAKINLAVEHKSLNQEKVLNDAFTYAKENNKNVHFLGLVSDGGVHSHTAHLRGLLDAANDFGLKNVFVHAFTDGRDVDPKSGAKYIQDLEEYLQSSSAKLASVVGRYYAMDRDKRWERVKKAYDLVVNGKGVHSINAVNSILASYHNHVTDEFIEPIVMVDMNNKPIATIKEDDVVIFFNFRTDRGRQLTEALSQRDFHEQNMHKMSLYYVTMTNYDDTFENVNVIYDKDNITETLGEILEKNNKKQIRIAETEKYPHVTFFFSGGREEPFVGESRILCPSPKVATYDLQPEMSAFELKDALVAELKKGEVDFVCLNFANGDMVGHTGVMAAAIKACEAVDVCVKEVIETALENNYTTLVIADHGNCETMVNPDGSPHTAHTTNPVPLILVDKELKQIYNGVLGDVAPTILELMGIEKPKAMTRHSLLSAFSLEEIHEAHSHVKSGADFPRYANELKNMGVLKYENFVADGKTIYFGVNDFSLTDEPKYERIKISNDPSTLELERVIKTHQQGQTDYKTFCIQAAAAGAYKWICDFTDMTCSYCDADGNTMIIEDIPNYTH